jgi:hypothetical protein
MKADWNEIRVLEMQGWGGTRAAFSGDRGIPETANRRCPRESANSVCARGYHMA